MESGTTSKGQATKKSLCGTNSRACLVPFKIITFCKVIHVLVKGVVGYGPVYAKRKSLCFETLMRKSVSHSNVACLFFSYATNNTNKVNRVDFAAAE